MISAGVPRPRGRMPTTSGSPVPVVARPQNLAQQGYAVVFATPGQKNVAPLAGIVRAISDEIAKRGMFGVVRDDSSYASVEGAINRCMNNEKEREKIVCISRAGGLLSVRWLFVVSAYSDNKSRIMVSITCVNQASKKEKRTIAFPLDNRDPKKFSDLAKDVVACMLDNPPTPAAVCASTSGVAVNVSQFDPNRVFLPFEQQDLDLFAPVPATGPTAPASTAAKGELPPLGPLLAGDAASVTKGPDKTPVATTHHQLDPDWPGPPPAPPPPVMAFALPESDSKSDATADVVTQPQPVPAFVQPMFKLEDLTAATKRHWRPISLFGGSALFITAAGFLGRAANAYEERSHSETKKMNAFAQYDTARDYSIATNVTLGVAALAASAAVFFMVKGDAATSTDVPPPAK